MNIHIVKEADGNGIVAIFGSNGSMSPHNLEQAVEKAWDVARDNLDTYATESVIEFMVAYLEKNYYGAFHIPHADTDHPKHAFTTSEMYVR